MIKVERVETNFYCINLAFSGEAFFKFSSDSAFESK